MNLTETESLSNISHTSTFADIFNDSLKTFLMSNYATITNQRGINQLNYLFCIGFYHFINLAQIQNFGSNTLCYRNSLLGLF